MIIANSRHLLWHVFQNNKIGIACVDCIDELFQQCVICKQSALGRALAAKNMAMNAVWPCLQERCDGQVLNSLYT